MKTTTRIKKPWRRDTNSKYFELVKFIMGFSIVSVLLPVFLSREFLGIKNTTPLMCIFEWSIYVAWILSAISLIFGVFYLHLSAKWMRLAWGLPTKVFFCNAKDRIIERMMDCSFWICLATYAGGLVLTVVFFISYVKK